MILEALMTLAKGLGVSDYLSGEYVEHIALTAAPESSRAIAKILTYEPETWYSMGSATAEIMLQIK